MARSKQGKFKRAREKKTLTPKETRVRDKSIAKPKKVRRLGPGRTRGRSFYKTGRTGRCPICEKAEPAIRNDVNLWIRRNKQPGEIITIIYNQHAVELNIMDVRWHLEEKHAFRKSARSKLQVLEEPPPGLTMHFPDIKKAEALAKTPDKILSLGGRLKFTQRLAFAVEEMEEVLRITLARFRNGEVNEKVITNVLKTYNDMVLKAGKFEQGIRAEPAVNKTYITMQTLNILRKNDVELANKVATALNWDPGKKAALTQGNLSYGPEDRALLDAQHRGKLVVEKRAPGEILAATRDAFEIVPVRDLKPSDLEDM